MSGYPENWPEISYAAKLRARFACAMCGEVSDPWNYFELHTHHKDMDKNNCDSSNLKVLCKGCHFKVHLENDPLFFFSGEVESYNRYGLPMPVRVGEVISEVLPKYLKIQRFFLKGGIP